MCNTQSINYEKNPSMESVAASGPELRTDLTYETTTNNRMYVNECRQVSNRNSIQNTTLHLLNKLAFN